ncbi:HAMP domain-containing histidine kinase [Sediminibacterium roseum]|uniref:histidine kinase n=1 Tax=Sediminibacterium roseum TaxID=1978412 RepID=A0ABW9ZNC3_9BACT|nr:HAMP domain-containing sensor histidine kinase [Sediminibacterium roseum]NCI48580.1 HAMP domain-containing histidine kinase [Sediminibacterium roseum]
MGPSNKLNLSRVLLSSAILLIVAFQCYWLNRLYKDEWQGLKKETNGIFRDVIYNVQLQRFSRDSFIRRQVAGTNLFAHTAVNVLRSQTAALPDKAKKRLQDSLRQDSISRAGAAPPSGFTFKIVNRNTGDSLPVVKGIALRGDLPPEIAARIAARGQISHVKLPPLMDSAMLDRMAVEGVKIVVNQRYDSASPQTTHLRTVQGAAAISNILLEKPAKAKKGKPVATSIIRATAATTTSGIIVSNRLPSRLRENSFIRLISNGKVIDDTIPVRKLDSAYRKELSKAGIPISFYIKKGADDSLHWKDTIPATVFSTGTAGAGLIHPFWYQAGFEDPTAFLLKKISLQILFSVFLVAFTSLAFIFLYRNLMAQRKLTEMKNDFISNITHELKTPLATVSVAVEALRNFGGIQNPERTKEYLDISASELQRLSLLVDKVLKLSLFENRELELKKEMFDLRELTEEVLNTMKLQFDTNKAKVELDVQGNYFTIHADRLHITSVIFNLLDNALKYSNGKPHIFIRLHHQTDQVMLQVEDKGIGIAPDFKSKIFDKFFRVPTGNHHNIKGYGLGLSYVAHVIRQHNGTISVDSEPGHGSTFTVKFPIT